MREIKSWSIFIEIIQGLQLGSQRLAKYLFRGQADARWDLESSFGRHAKNNDVRWALDREFHMQRLFRLDAHNYISSPILPSHTNQLELWWSAMQHYGVSTRLLDWSCSPFVAAYFAVEDLSDKDGAIWIVHPHTVNKVAKDKYGFDGIEFVDRFITEDDTDLLWFYEPAVKTDRMLAQQCCFSVAANPIKEHSKILLSNHDEGCLYKYTIPSHLKVEFLRNLNYMNITARTIYPGLDGLGKSVQEFLKVEAART